MSVRSVLGGAGSPWRWHCRSSYPTGQRRRSRVCTSTSVGLGGIVTLQRTRLGPRGAGSARSPTRGEPEPTQASSDCGSASIPKQALRLRLPPASRAGERSV